MHLEVYHDNTTYVGVLEDHDLRFPERMNVTQDFIFVVDNNNATLVTAVLALAPNCTSFVLLLCSYPVPFTVRGFVDAKYLLAGATIPIDYNFTIDPLSIPPT